MTSSFVLSARASMTITYATLYRTLLRVGQLWRGDGDEVCYQVTEGDRVSRGTRERDGEGCDAGRSSVVDFNHRRVASIHASPDAPRAHPPRPLAFSYVSTYPLSRSSGTRCTRGRAEASARVDVAPV